MELTVKKEVEETVSIDLPVYFKEPNKHKYLGVLNDNQVIIFTMVKGISSYQNGELWLFKSSIKEAVSDEWDRIDEDTFIAIHEDFLRLQSLSPVLIENDDADDLKNVNF